MLCLFPKIFAISYEHFSFSVQNLTQQRYIKAVEIARENKPHISTGRKNEASMFEIQVNLCFLRNM